MLAALSGAAQPAAPAGYDFPPRSGRVVDRAHVLSPAQEAAIEARLATLERTTHHQFVVVTVPSLGGHRIEDYGVRLGNAWRVGRKGVNDGVLLIVAPTERKVRIEVGNGLGTALRDDEAAAILRRDVLPAFGRGDLPAGIAAGVDDVIREITPHRRKAA